jgi:hypothetical protein
VSLKERGLGLRKMENGCIVEMCPLVSSLSPSAASILNSLGCFFENMKTQIIITLLAILLTATPAPLILGELNPYLVSVGEHGAMVCIKPDYPEQLEGIVLKANIIQLEKTLDRNVGLENMGEHGSCFEVIDAKYQIDVPIHVELSATSTEKPIENGRQISELSPFQYFPFIYPMLAQNEYSDNVDIGPLHGYETGLSHAWYATDICVIECSPRGDYSAYGKSVFMPFSMKVLWISDETPNGHNIVILNPYTVYSLLLSHQEPSSALMAELGNPNLPYFARSPKTIPYDPEMIIATWSLPKDGKIPHLHIEGQIHSPNHPDNWAHVYIMDGNTRYGNCGVNGNKVLSGPCPPNVLSIYIELFLLDGWFK